MRFEWNHPIVKEYIEASKNAAKYYKVECCEPPEATKRYKLALDNYRIYLDMLEIKMPMSKFPYDKNNEATWKYKDHVISLLKNNRFVEPIMNDTWIYKDIA